MPSVHRNGHFVDNKQSHCRPVIRSSSQSENTAHVSREEFARDVSNSNNLCAHVNQEENALTKMIESLTGVIAKFENLVNGMSCSNDTKSKQDGTGLPHVFVSPSQSEDHVKSSLVKTLLKMLMSTLIQLTPLFARTKCI